jgi:3-oxoacyl-[acyl-carrier protein] reductase
MKTERKVAVVTGAPGGIGSAVCKKLAQAGCDIVINHYKTQQAAEDLAAKLQELGAKTFICEANVADFEEAGRLMNEAQEAFGRIDILVNNAGITRDNLLARMKEEDFDAVIAVNLKSAFNCSKHAVSRMMKQRYGRIINMSSIVGIAGSAGQVNYAASKAGLIGITKSLAREVASRNIMVNAVAPGFIETEMTQAIPDKMREAMLESIPARRPGTPEDVAGAVSFLVSEDADYITGQVLVVAGGLLI